MLSKISGLAALSAMAIGSVVLGQTVIQPTAAESKDTFVYSFLPTFNFNASPGFDVILASGRSSTGHDLRSLIQFDLTSASLAPGQIATLNLFVTDRTAVGFPVADPSPAFPVQADLFPVTQAWDAAAVTWGSQPATGATAVASEAIDGVNKYVTFDVTSQVQAWLDNPASNFGFSIQQPEVVLNGGSVQAVYHSAGNTQRPFLYVGPVPEPTTLAVLASAGGLLILRRRA